jgi:O-acetyl-ADP-ribose deacetylase
MEPFMSTYTINNVTLALLQGNIAEVQADAIVNAANAALAGGGGVDGAIHRAGGSAIMAECRRIGGCPTGSAVATTAGNLQARYVFHAVGPIYQAQGDEEPLLIGAYQSCLKLAEQHRLQSIAFPSISTGAYHYPVKSAARIALQTVIHHVQHAQQPTSLQQILFVLFDRHTYDVYEQAIQKILAE